MSGTREKPGDLPAVQKREESSLAKNLRIGAWVLAGIGGLWVLKTVLTLALSPLGLVALAAGGGAWAWWRFGRKDKAAEAASAPSEASHSAVIERVGASPVEFTRTQSAPLATPGASATPESPPRSPEQEARDSIARSEAALAELKARMKLES